MALSYAISALPAIVATASGDLLPIVDVSDFTESPTGTTKKITVAQLFTSVPSAVTFASTLAVTGITTLNGINRVLGSGAAAVGTAGLRFGDVNSGGSRDYALSDGYGAGGAAIGALVLSVSTAQGGDPLAAGAEVMRWTASTTTFHTDLAFSVSSNLGTSGNRFGAAFGASLNLSGAATIGTSLNPDTDNGADFGSPSLHWANAYVTDLFAAGNTIVSGTFSAVGTSSFSDNVAIVAGVSVGTITNNDWYLRSNNTQRWIIEKSGALLGFIDNLYDIGANIANRPRTGYFGTSVIAPLFTGNLTGNVTGNTSGSAATVTSASQTAITTLSNLVTVGALNSGSIASGFGSIDVGANAISGGTITGTSLVGPLTGIVNVGTGTGAAGRIYKTATNGTVIRLAGGSLTDFAILDPSGSSIATVLTGAPNIRFEGTITTPSAVNADTLTAVTSATITGVGGSPALTLTAGNLVISSGAVTVSSTGTFSGDATGNVILPHRTAPGLPANGAMWTTTAGLFVRINGSTVGPLS